MREVTWNVQLMCMYACINKQACKTRGIGACTPRKFFEIRCSDIASEAILGQKQSCSSYMARHFLAVRVVTSWLLIFISSIGKDYYYI